MADQDSRRLLLNKKDYGLTGRLNKDNSDKALNARDIHVARPNHPVIDPTGTADLNAQRKHWGTNLVDQDEIGMNEKKEFIKK